MESPQRRNPQRVNYLDRLRLRLAGRSALLQLCILGLIVGILVGLLMLAFRGFVEGVQMLMLPDGNPENYEGLPVELRWLLPPIGGAILALLYLWIRPTRRQGGVVQVLERLAYHQGHMSSRTAFMEFLGAGVSLISGQSVGREGPSIHLGAAGGSVVGRHLRLPNNAIRTLVGCGAAGAIGAAFNTPLAGVIFAMEVVLMEYTIAGFAPIMLAAVGATAVTQIAYGGSPAFEIPEIHSLPVREMPLLVVVGAAIGGLSALFNASAVRLAGVLQPLSLAIRFPLAGIITGILAIAAPAIMGVGYDTVNIAMLGELGMLTLLLILFAKVLATSTAVGCNLPGGLIGPTLVIGALAGGIASGLAQMVLPDYAWQPAIYVLVGMAAMMAATLQAPLAGLMALLELSGDTLLIFPGMLTVVTAVIVAREFFGQDSLLLQLMRARGLDYRNDPVAQSLRRIGVASVMETSMARTAHEISLAQAQRLLDLAPRWLLLDTNGEDDRRYLLAAADLARFVTSEEHQKNPPETVNLLKIPGLRMETVPIAFEATLQEARDTITRREAQGVYVVRAHFDHPIHGVLTRESIENAYAR